MFFYAAHQRGQALPARPEASDSLQEGDILAEKIWLFSATCSPSSRKRSRAESRSRFMASATRSKEPWTYCSAPERCWLAENVEVFLVAIVIAAGAGHFLQPFKIPTGSMQPTLLESSDFDRESATKSPQPSGSARLARPQLHRCHRKEDDIILDLQEATYLNFYFHHNYR
jgi:hypothetical protein